MIPVPITCIPTRVATNPHMMITARKLVANFTFNGIFIILLRKRALVQSSHLLERTSGGKHDCSREQPDQKKTHISRRVRPGRSAACASVTIALLHSGLARYPCHSAPTAYIWFPHNPLISWVRPYNVPHLKARSTIRAKDLEMPCVPPGFAYGFRITSPVSTRMFQAHYHFCNGPGQSWADVLLHEADNSLHSRHL